MLNLPKQMRLRVIAVATAVALSPLAQAAGLGRITVLSGLGQPLRAELEISASRDELNSISARLASAEAFRAAGIEYATVLPSLRFSRDIKERSGRRYIEITTDRPVNEPFVDMLVELNWASGRLVREYTFLLDPPQTIPTQASSAVSTPVAGAETPVVKPAPEAPSAPVSAPATRPASRAQAVPATRPAASSLAAPSPAGSGAGSPSREVRAGDTLGKIAAETRPEGVSLDQMLVALFRSNEGAFDGNMNRLRAGKILQIPDAEAVKAVDPAAARKEVVAQSADFNAYRRRLADMVAGEAPAADSGSRAAAGKIAPKVEEKAAPVVAGKDKLEVSRNESPAAAKGGGKDAKAGSVGGRLSALEEDLVAREKALREANSRIVQLEKNLNDLKKLAELKSEAGVSLQKQAEAAKAAPTPAPAAPKPAEAPLKAAEAVAAPPATAPAAAPAPTPAAEAPKPDAPKPAEPPKPPAPKKVVPPPEPEPEPDFIEENGPLVFGGAGVLALLLGYLGFSAYRRKRKAAEGATPSQADIASVSAFSQAAESIDVTAAAPDNLSVSDTVPDAAGGVVDPLVEADTYLAFGRDAQAEEILVEALQKEPTRHAIHVKLLEIYSARRSTMQFNTLARELKEQTGGSGPEWGRVAAMGLALDAGNPLYQATPEPAAEPDTEATMVFSAPPAMEAPAPVPEVAVEPVTVAADEVASLDFDLDLGEAASPAPAAAPASTTAGDDSAAVLDFDLDLGDGNAAAAEAAPAAKADEAMALDIDLALDAPEVAAPEASAAAPALDVDFDLELPAADTPAAAPAPDVAAAPSLDLSLDIEMPSAAAAPEPLPAVDVPLAEPVAEAPAAGGNAIDFDFDLGDAPAVAVETPSAADAPALDLGGLSLELETPAAAPAAEASAPALDLSLDLPGDAPAAGLAAPDASVPDNPEAATKLELALAYEEMGDKDGARELLEEVVKEGSPSQAEQARAKLDTLG